MVVATFCKVEVELHRALIKDVSGNEINKILKTAFVTQSMTIEGNLSWC